MAVLHRGPRPRFSFVIEPHPEGGKVVRDADTTSLCEVRANSLLELE